MKIVKKKLVNVLQQLLQHHSFKGKILMYTALKSHLNITAL